MNPTTQGNASPNIAPINTLRKEWSTCTDAEKIEKLKAELNDFQYLTNRVVFLEQEVAKLKSHTHADGKVHVPLIDTHHQGVTGSYNFPGVSRTSYLN